MDRLCGLTAWVLKCICEYKMLKVLKFVVNNLIANSVDVERVQSVPPPPFQKIFGCVFSVVIPILILCITMACRQPISSRDMSP
jgi:hypothetical protein